MIRRADPEGVTEWGCRALLLSVAMPPSALEVKRRRAARSALYGGLLALVVVLGLFTALLSRAIEYRAQWGETDWAEKPEVQLLQAYARIPTTAGQEILGAEFLRDLLREEGIEATLEPLGDGSANLWAILEGESPETLVLHHHIDVYPAEDAEQWLHPPFEAEIEGPWLHGRGVFDMKSYAVAQLSAFLDIARSEVPRKRSLMLLATSDEESSSRLGTQWVLREHPELVERMWTVFTEGGIVEALNPDDIKYFGIETSQFQLVRAVACSPDRERLETLHQDLESWPANELEPILSPELEGFFADYGPTRSRRFTRLQLSAPRDLLPNRRGLDRLPRFARDLMGASIGAWPIARARGGGWKAELNLLIPPGADAEKTVERLLPEWVRHGIAWRIGEPEGASHGSPGDHPAFRAAAKALSSAYENAPVGRYFMPYNLTDARFFRQAGIDSYGFSPFLFFTTDTSRADQINERIPLPGFVSGVAAYVDAVRGLVLDAS